MRIVLNPFKSRPKVVIQAPVPKVVFVDHKAEWRDALFRKQTKRAVIVNELAVLDSEIATLIGKIG